MHIHHLNCGTMCPIGGKLIRSVFPNNIVCHCWLIDTGNGLLLVDTGIGTHDIEHPSRLGLFRNMLGFQRVMEETAVHQVRALGYKPEDVRWIIPTHLDVDHAGGIADFPNATVHVWADEYNMAHAQYSFMDRQRYRACQWEKHEHWHLHEETSGESWFGFEAVRQIPGLPPELLMLPLPGHSFGHWCIALEQSDGWLLHVGDSYYHRRELADSVPATLHLFHRLVHHDYRAAMNNVQRLKGLAEVHPEVTLVSAHDPDELAHCRHRCGHSVA